ncbi:hypothetical protein DNH61_25295 [Paenibacillus sambharensis]|uniref:Copper amine oxidase-like N-terminal domain-containing protein n=2 Tax=Paenibacillus sambharensis TaxID=1803190 RepID=A0A2W1LMV2_9BACL|nr:hypothetical protein DNH61_25295 [Paenibacillus sambharensis]
MGGPLWKRLIACLIVLVLTYGALSLFIPKRAEAASPITVFVDLAQVQFDVEPVVVKGTTLVQFRPLFEAMKIDVAWDSSRKLVTGTKPGLTIELEIDKKTAVVNGSAVELEQPASIIDGSTMVPLRFIGEATGAIVYWDGVHREITIITEEMLEMLGVTKEEMMAKLSEYEAKKPDATPAELPDNTKKPKPSDSDSSGASPEGKADTPASPTPKPDGRKPAEYGSGEYKAASGKPELGKLQGMYTGMRADMYGYECGGLCIDMFTFFSGGKVFVGLPPHGGPETIDCKRDGCQTYTIKDGKMKVNGGETYSVSISKDGKLKINDVVMDPVKPVKEGMTLSGEYVHKGYSGMVGITTYSTAWTELLVFKRDGTFESEDLSLGTLDTGSAVTNSASGDESTGTYRISGNTIILAFNDGRREQLFFGVLENTKRAKGEDLVIGDKNFYVDRKE